MTNGVVKDSYNHIKEKEKEQKEKDYKNREIEPDRNKMADLQNIYILTVK